MGTTNKIKLPQDQVELLEDEILQWVRDEDTESFVTWLDEECEIPYTKIQLFEDTFREHLRELGNDVSELGGSFDFSVLDRTVENRQKFSDFLNSIFQIKGVKKYRWLET